MRNEPAPSKVGRQNLRSRERSRRAGALHEASALGAARAGLRQVAQDLRRNRRELTALVYRLRTTEPTPENSYLCSDGAALSIEEWAADCADVVSDGLDDLAQLAESFAGADWRADVTDWLDPPPKGVASGRSRD